MFHVEHRREGVRELPTWNIGEEPSSNVPRGTSEGRRKRMICEEHRRRAANECSIWNLRRDR